ncbi:efflux RND transporter periplasmic adaptor subunit [uncultured Microscilla sp.]|uniref:efflux RND transporter periplasmic adaptor subunit n=1 Tax=uncultured Microscilla sp. TaxID=432653 RepID=UPI00261D0806|nr:efflux RND transporter periplasmic adaptor subunit [uncultured Microscilla sp.]
MKSINTYVIALMTASLLGACSAKKQHTNLAKAQVKTQQLPIKVTVAKATLSKTEGNLSYSGTIEPSTSIPLSFLMPGLVKGIYVKEGQRVNKGQLLARLSQDSQQSGYELALAKQKHAEHAYHNLKPMYKSGSLPEMKWVEVKTGYEQANAAVALAKTNLNNGDLHAPVGGVIGRKMLEPGMTALPGTPVIQLVQLHQLAVKVSVPEGEISQIKTGQQAQIKISALQDKVFAGTVTEIGVMANAISRTYDVKIAIANVQNEIKPGMMCNVSLEQRQAAKLLVPYQAVSNDIEGETYVYVVNRQTMEAKKQAVKVGLFRQNQIEVLAGLQTGQQVVVRGKHKLTDHAKISIQ